MPSKLTMHYFALPGRAEVSRLIAAVAGLELEDKVYGGAPGQANWPEFKPKAPFGQLPVLEVDGQYIAQSIVIEEYLAELAGLQPKGSAVQVAQAKSVVHLLNDIWSLFTATFSIKDADEKVKARQAIVAGPLQEKLAVLGNIVKANGGWTTSSGALTYVDLALYSQLSQLASGWLDGVPPTLLNDHPVLKEFHAKVAGVEAVKNKYANLPAEDKIRPAYKQLP